MMISNKSIFLLGMLVFNCICNASENISPNSSFENPTTHKVYRPVEWFKERTSAEMDGTVLMRTEDCVDWQVAQKL